MRVPRLYVAEPLKVGQSLPLDAKASHYLCTVLRLEAGRELVVFNGDGSEYCATLTHAHKKNANIQLVAKQEVTRESPLTSHLVIGVSRGERFDFVLQKAAELGVTEITPVFTERTEVRLKGERLEKKAEHWQQILISACEQCQRNVLPKINSAVDLQQLMQSPAQGLALVLHHRSEHSIQSLLKPTSVTLLIGPEGGLTDAEIAQAQAQNYVPLTLGPRVLRTETAPIVALTAVQLLWGDL